MLDLDQKQTSHGEKVFSNRAEFGTFEKVPDHKGETVIEDHMSFEPKEPSLEGERS